jgi:hypothetical protein
MSLTSVLPKTPKNKGFQGILPPERAIANHIVRLHFIANYRGSFSKYEYQVGYLLIT